MDKDRLDIKLKQKISSLISEYPGATLGILIGALIGLLAIAFGPLKAIIFMIFVLIGYFIGHILLDRYKKP